MEDAVPDRDEALQQRIRDRAYRLWEEEGRPDGKAAEHWMRASAMEAERLNDEDRIDEEGMESFPASDPPSHGGFTGDRPHPPH